MTRTFPYLRKGNQYFPVIDVELRHGRVALRLKALVDSGASLSVFRAEVAEYLGIRIEKGKPIYLTGIGGRILGYLHTLPVRVGSTRFRCKIVFSKEFTVSLNILGRDNFFQPFLITFAERRRQLILRDI